MAEEHTFGGSGLSSDDHVDRNTDHHQRPLDTNLKSSFAAEERAPAPPDFTQNDSFSPEAPPTASGTGAKLQATDCRDRPSFTADFGTATSFDENNLDFLLQTMQREYQDGDPMQSAGSQLETDTNKEGGREEEEEEEKTFHCVLRQMQQQQMHKRGRKFKKKTLVKMAKLFVIAKGWDSKMTETSDVSSSSGASAERGPSELNLREDTVTSVSQPETIQTETLKDDCDGKTITSTVFIDMTLPLKKRKRPSVCKKQTNEESQTECRTDTSAGLLNRDTWRNTDSLTLQEDPEISCDHSKLFGNSPKETSSIDAPKTSFKGRRRKRAKASRVGVKKSSRQKRLPPAVTQDVSEGLSVSSDEPLLDTKSSVQDTVTDEIHLNAIKQERDETEASAPTCEALLQDEISPVESAPSAAPAKKVNGKRQRRNRTVLNQSVLSSISINKTFSDQTAAPVAKRRTRVKEESELSAAAETDCRAATDLLCESSVGQDSGAYSRPGKASKRKGTSRKTDSVTLIEDPEVTPDNSEKPGIICVKISDVNSTVNTSLKGRRRKTAKASRLGVKKSSRQKHLPQTFTDTVSNRMDLTPADEIHSQSEASALTPEAASLLQDESAPSAAPAEKVIRMRQRRNKTGSDEQDTGTDLSLNSADTTLAPTKKRKTVSSNKKPVKEESELSEAAETDCSTDTGLLKGSQSVLFSSPETVSEKKRKSRKTDPVALKEDPEISEISEMIPGNISGDHVTKQASLKGRRKTAKASRVCVKKSSRQKHLPQTFTEAVSSVTDSVSNGMDLTTADETRSKSEASGPTSLNIPAESAPSAAPAKKVIRKRQRRNKTGLDQQDTETVLSLFSTNKKCSDQTAAPVAKRRTRVKEQSELSAAAETDCRAATDLLCESSVGQDSGAYSRPGKASKRKGTSRKTDSVTLIEDPEVTPDNSEKPGIICVKISDVNSTVNTSLKGRRRKTAKASRVGVKKSSRQKRLPHQKSSVQDTVTDEIHLNAIKQEHDETEASAPTCEALLQDEISPVESAPSAAPAKKGPRRNKTGTNQSVHSAISTNKKCSDQTAAPVAKRKTRVKEESELSTDLFCEDKLRNIDSLILKDPESSCENSKVCGNHSVQTSSVDAPKRAFKGRRRKRAKASRVCVKKSSREKRLSVSSDELSSVQVDCAVKPEQDKTQASDITSKAASSCQDEISPVQSAPSVIRTRRRMDQSVLSLSSTDTFSDQTAASCRKKRVKKESESVLISSPETAPDKKVKTRKTDSVALEEDSEIPATKQTLKGRKRKTNISRVGVKRSSRQKVLPVKDHSTQDVSEGVMMSPNDPHHGANASILNDAKEEHSETSASASSFVAEVNPVESAPPAALPARTKRRRRKKQPQWAQRKTPKRRQIRVEQSSVPAKVEVSASPCRSASGDKVCGRRRDLKPKKPIWCSFCGRSFRHITAFTHHKRLHSGEKPFSCPTCSKRFSQLSQLRMHSRLHSQDQLVCCPCCSKRFKTKDQLILHFHVHMRATRRSKVKEPAAGVDSRKGFRFLTRATFRMPRRKHSCRRKFCSSLSSAEPQTLPSCSSGRNSGADGFMASHTAQAHIVTPLYFKCPICKHLHRHWCQYVLHLQTHAGSSSYVCLSCKQQYQHPAEVRRHCAVCCRRSGEEAACRSSLPHIWKEPEAPEDQEVELQPEQAGQGSASPPQETGEKVIEEQPPSLGSDPCPSRRPLRSGFSCGRCGRSFSQWNKLILHQRFHPQVGRSFSCSRCHLEFRFLASYLDHLQEHAARTPLTCPLCPDTFPSETSLSSHVSERHQQRDSMKCRICGKSFSSWKNLKRHKLLHGGFASYSCLQCDASFSSPGALKKHLKSHRTRVQVPQPVGLVQPLSFPYECEKCPAKFSSTDLLQAHQVCHYEPSTAPEQPRGDGSEPGWCLRVSNKKDLFRYPHPDHLYVLPAAPSEEEQEAQVQSLSTTTSVPSSSSTESQPDAASSNIPQSCQDLSEPHPDQDDAEEVTSVSSGDSSDTGSSEPCLVFSEEEEFMDVVQSCVICMEPFTDESKLHEHYIEHTRRKKPSAASSQQEL